MGTVGGACLTLFFFILLNKYCMHSITLRGLATLTALTLLPGFASAAITVGATADHRDGDTETTTNTISNFEVVAGYNRKLVLTINSETTATVTSITYGGQSFIKAVDSGGSRMSQIWYLDDAAVGTADIVATFSDKVRSYMGVVSLTGASAGEPSAHSTEIQLVGGEATATQASMDFKTTEADNFVIAAYTQNSGNGFPYNPISMTDLYRADSGSSASAAGYQIQRRAGAQTYTWEAPAGDVMHTSNAVAIASFGAAR